jgi:hypothetical protein
MSGHEHREWSRVSASNDVEFESLDPHGPWSEGRR